VIVALLGLVVTCALEWLPRVGTELIVLSLGAPVAAVLVRRRLLPRLSPPANASHVAPTAIRRLTSYVLMIGAGLVLFVDGICVWVMACDRAALPMLIGLALFAAAGWVEMVGFRRAA
jgi:hypothetical protein